MAKERSKPNRQPRDGAKKKKGFSVGPANLPDGTYKRKVDKIKKTLIQKAKVKKQYSKTLAQVQPESDPYALRAKKLLEEAEQERLERNKKREELGPEAKIVEDQPSTGIHPDRQAAIDESAKDPEESREQRPSERRTRGPKPSRFMKEEKLAREKKEKREKAMKEAEIRRKEREQALKRREARKTMMTSRTRTGQYKLGKMSHILLEKIERQRATKN